MDAGEATAAAVATDIVRVGSQVAFFDPDVRTRPVCQRRARCAGTHAMPP